MLRALLVLFALAVGSAYAQPDAGKDAGKDAKKDAKKEAKKPDAKKPEAKKPVAKAKAQVRPAWAELNAEQQKVLAPLKADWESLNQDRRKKWVGIANRYPKMSAQDQERVQRRMQRWASLTPEQRRQARETYMQISKERQQKKGEDLRQRWAEYQSLPPDQRMHLTPPPAPGAKKK